MSVDLAREIQFLQESLCLTYSVLCSCPFYAIDTTNRTEAEVKAVALTLFSKIGMKVI